MMNSLSFWNSENFNLDWSGLLNGALAVGPKLKVFPSLFSFIKSSSKYNLSCSQWGEKSKSRPLKETLNNTII